MLASTVLLTIVFLNLPTNGLHPEAMDTTTPEVAHSASPLGTNMYVPSISIVKSAPVFNGGDCGGIPFTYTITNQGSLGEDLQDVVVTDMDFGGIVAGPNPGDFTGDNGNGILDAGETWTTNRDHVITQTDLDNGQFGQFPANVNAALVSNPSIEVGDVSHPSDPFDDGPTIVDLTNCQNPDIGLLLEWEYFDLDSDACTESFLYTFTIRNTGDISLHNIVLEDPLLGGAVPGPLPNSDVGDDGILSPGEEWQYMALFSTDLQQSGEVINQANVTAYTLVQNIAVSDLSDDDSFFEDEATHTPYDDVCMGAFVRIGLIKEATDSLDLNNDGCFDAIQYTFTVRNVKDAPLENIVLSDPLLGGEISNLISNGNGDAILDVGESWVYQGQYEVTQADVVNGSVNNQALVTAKLVGYDIFLFDYSDDNSFDENDATGEQMENYCGPPSIGLIKPLGSLQDLDSNGCYETIGYTFTVVNTGGIDLGQVVLTDPDLNAPIIGPQGDINNDQILSVGETWTYQASNPITQSDIDAGSVTNQAQVTAIELVTNGIVSDISDHTNVDEDRETVTVLSGIFCPATSKIGLIKRTPFGSFEDLDNDGCPETIRYSFDVANTGTIPLENIVLNDDKLGGILEVFTSFQGDDNNDQILSVGEEWTYQVLYPITEQDIIDTQVTNQAQVTANEWGTSNQVMDDSDDDSYDENESTVTSTAGACFAEAGIGLLKTAVLMDLNGDSCFETVQYTFTVANTGNIELDQVLLTDIHLNGEVTGLVQSSDTNGDGILSVGEEWTYIASYGITVSDITADEIRNRAQVSAQEVISDAPVFDDSDPSAYDQDRETVITPLVNVCPAEATISLTKFVGVSDFLDQNMDGCVETIRYNFTVANTGVIDMEGVILTDNNLGGGPISGPIPISDTNNDGILSIGETWTYEALYSLTPQDITDLQVTNQADVTAFERNTSNEVSIMDEITTPLGMNVCPGEAEIELVKAGSLANLDGDNCPESIYYTFTVANTGTINLAQIVLTDTDLNAPIIGPQGDTGNDQILSVGETWTYEATYPITQIDIDGVNVTNQANVSAVAQNTNSPAGDSSEVVITDVTGACVAQASIGLIKTAGSALVDVDRDGCPENVSYTFTVKNTGTITLEQVVLSDSKLGPGSIMGPLPGNDINGDMLLSIDETWTYQALYPITLSDIGANTVTNQAQVSAFEFGTTNQVEDASDDNSFDEDDQTITSVAGACPAQGQVELIKAGNLVDLDGDDCPESIRYTFTVQNMGTLNLQQIVINDDLLEGVTIEGPLSGSDIDGDNILSVNETWIYEALYTISQENYDQGEVTNQARVSALEVSTNNTVTDDSNTVIITITDFCINSNAAFEIFNGVTPNGDGINDYFRINGIENYPDNILKVFNRWGVLVFEAEGYGTTGSLFAGHSEGRATVAENRELPSGTYFYTLTFMGNNPGKESYSGYLYINRD
ncbi:MAG: gliding motility-associated C-terminal domain-containing protein [Allomuricauda sp.]